ncbi:hypothetical protein CSKR_100550 [Clonorchis sinensis]|uniref:Uncharacterized protein n=1 Tax=Clonorchis sinensis TaxID=79923 RepID=A0A419PZR9_CLOSI|nr:hypothetical protein CSKR_100550 [Clonorchis sinensis]
MEPKGLPLCLAADKGIQQPTDVCGVNLHPGCQTRGIRFASARTRKKVSNKHLNWVLDKARTTVGERLFRAATTRNEKSLPNESVPSELENLPNLSLPFVCWVNGVKTLFKAGHKQLGWHIQGAVGPRLYIVFGSLCEEGVHRIISRRADAFWTDFPWCSVKAMLEESQMPESFLPSILVMSSGPFLQCTAKAFVEPPPNDIWTHSDEAASPTTVALQRLHPL